VQARPWYSERRACGLVGWWRSSYRYRRRRNDQALRARWRELIERRPGFGYRRLHVLLRREGWPVNRKRVYRIYREEGWAVRRRKRKARATIPRVPLPAPSRPNQGWSMDYIHDALAAGRKFKVLTIEDQFAREALATEPEPRQTNKTRSWRKMLCGRQTRHEDRSSPMAACKSFRHRHHGRNSDGTESPFAESVFNMRRTTRTTVILLLSANLAFWIFFWVDFSRRLVPYRQHHAVFEEVLPMFVFHGKALPAAEQMTARPLRLAQQVQMPSFLAVRPVVYTLNQKPSAWEETY
jgi:transposase InsO family protein